MPVSVISDVTEDPPAVVVTLEKVSVAAPPITVAPPAAAEAPPIATEPKKRKLSGKSVENHKRATQVRVERMLAARKIREAETAAVKQERLDAEERELACRLAVKYGFVVPQQTPTTHSTVIEPPPPPTPIQPPKFRYAPRCAINFVR